MVKILKNLAEAQAVFNGLGLRYNMNTFRYCAEHDIDLSGITVYSQKNLLDLIMYGTPNISPTEAYDIIEKGTEQGLSFPMLHTLAVKEARANGFFITEADTKIMSEMDLTNMDVLKTILPTISQELTTLTNYQENMKNAL